MCKIADVAQLAEQLICNQQVIRSNRIIGSKITYNKFVSRIAYRVSREENKRKKPGTGLVYSIEYIVYSKEI